MEAVRAFDAQAVAGNFGEAMKNAFGANSHYSVMSIISAFAWGLGYFGMPHIIVRFMGIDSVSSIKTARRIGVSWMVISYIGTFIIGTVGTAYLLNHGILLNGGSGRIYRTLGIYPDSDNSNCKVNFGKNQKINFL